MAAATLFALAAAPGLPRASAPAAPPLSPSSSPPAAPEHGKATTCDASTVGGGVLEVELGYAPSWNERGGTAGFEPLAPGHTHPIGLSVTWGLGEDTDLWLAAGLAATWDEGHQQPDGSAPRRGGGPTDATLGAKHRLLASAAHALELAILGELVAPVGTRDTPSAIGLTQGHWSARAALVATRDLGPLTANLEVGGSAPLGGDPEGVGASALVGAAAGWQVLPWLQPELELTWRASATGTRLLTATVGAVLPLGAAHRLTVAVQPALWGRDTGRTTSALLAFKTALGYPPPPGLRRNTADSGGSVSASE